MSIDIYDTQCLAFSRNNTTYRRGIKSIEEWHEKCRRERLNAAIEAKKRELALKRIAAERDRLIKKSSK